MAESEPKITGAEIWPFPSWECFNFLGLDLRTFKPDFSKSWSQRSDSEGLGGKARNYQAWVIGGFLSSPDDSDV